MANSFSNLPGRAQFAAAGAGLAVQNRFAGDKSKGKVANTLFLALMLLALTIAITAIFAILLWAFIEGRTRLDADLVFNGPSTVNRATAGYSVAILGTLQIIGGVIALIIPLGVGAALYLEQPMVAVAEPRKLEVSGVKELADASISYHSILDITHCVADTG